MKFYVFFACFAILRQHFLMRAPAVCGCRWSYSAQILHMFKVLALGFLRHSVILVLYSNGRVKHVLSSLSIFQHHTLTDGASASKALWPCLFLFSDGDFETPKWWFEGFEMKSMVEKHAKSLQGFAEEVIFDNLALFWVCPKGKTWWIKFHCCFFSSFFCATYCIFQEWWKNIAFVLGVFISWLTTFRFHRNHGTEMGDGRWERGSDAGWLLKAQQLWSEIPAINQL